MHLQGRGLPRRLPGTLQDRLRRSPAPRAPGALLRVHARVGPCRPVTCGSSAIGLHSHGYVAETDAQAREDFWPAYKGMHDRIGAERGWPPMQRAAFDQEADHGSLYVGSPETVARKITATVKALGLSRFDLKHSAGALAHENIMRCIGLYGSKVIPRVREMLV